MLYSACDAIARHRNLPCGVVARGFDRKLPQRSGSGRAGNSARRAGSKQRYAGSKQRRADSERRYAGTA